MTLERFKVAQDPLWDSVLAELRAGQKRTHWSWFVFPQLSGLGESTLSRRFALTSAGEAAEFWRHPVFGPRLRECIEQMLTHAGRFTPTQVLGGVDAMKLRSCLTLFESAVPQEPLFSEALDALYQGRRDERTLALLRSAQDSR